MMHDELYELKCPYDIHYICDMALTCNGALCSTPFRSDPIGESEPDPGCSFNYFYLFVFFFKSVAT